MLRDSLTASFCISVIGLDDIDLSSYKLYFTPRLEVIGLIVILFGPSISFIDYFVAITLRSLFSHSHEDFLPHPHEAGFSPFTIFITSACASVPFLGIHHVPFP